MKLPNYREAKLIEVIRVETCEGAGEDEDPYRPVITYWSKDGKILAVVDQWQENQRALQRLMSSAQAFGESQPTDTILKSPQPSPPLAQ